MKKTIKSSKSSKTLFIGGFTLIEMLVVIAIIAILSGIIITNLSGAKGKARDSKRVSDLGNIQMALELYFDRCNSYPISPLNSTGSGCTKFNTNTNAMYTFSDFMSPIPTAPNANEVYNYKPEPNTSANYLRSYMLQTTLESPNAVQKDSIKEADKANYSCSSPPIYCYNDISASPDNYYCLASPNIPKGGSCTPP
jgi:prepilin-type N-terminal cleavage/methylation domain-containing protein